MHEPNYNVTQSSAYLRQRPTVRSIKVHRIPHTPRYHSDISIHTYKKTDRGENITSWPEVITKKIMKKQGNLIKEQLIIGTNDSSVHECISDVVAKCCYDIKQN